jgi:uncharacterized membrane protein YgcG
MEFVQALADTFAVTQFDVMLGLFIGIASIVFYYFLTLHTIFEAAFGAIVWLGIYILLSVLLLGNQTLWSEGGLFPFGFSVIIISIAVYLVFILAVLFPLHWGLVISEPTHPTLYTIIYFITSGVLLFSFATIIVYMIEQAYIFKVGTFFTFFKDSLFYTESVKPSHFYGYVMWAQYFIIPLGVVLMLYKLLLSNLVNAALLSIWYNLSNVWFYRKKEDSHYRVEFHEVGWHASSGHDDHKSGDHGWWHDDHGHSGWHGSGGGWHH